MRPQRKLLFLCYVKKYFRTKERRRQKLMTMLINQVLFSFEMRKYASFVELNMILKTITKAPRRIWALDRDECWFEDLWDNRHNPDYMNRWKEGFRMSGRTFEKLVNLLRGSLEKRDTHFRKAIPVKKCVAVALRRLANGNSFRTTSKTLAVGKSTAVEITNKFCEVLSRYERFFIKFSVNRRDIAEAIVKFRESENCIIPQALGVIDATHAPILAPDIKSKPDYFSRKEKYSVNTQAVIGSNLDFLSVATGYPGSMHDARILRNTFLFQRAENRNILCSPADVIEGLRIRPLILADSASPLKDWLIKPYIFSANLTRSEKRFSRRLSASRSTVERGFGLLKAKWRCLLKRLDHEIENISNVIIACFILHNICQISRDEYVDNDGLLENIVQQEREARLRRRQNHDADPQANDVIETH